MNRKAIKARIREVEGNIRFEEGRLSMLEEAGLEMHVTRQSIQTTITGMNAVVATFKEVLNS